MHNVNEVVHTTYGQFVYILYDFFPVHTTYRKSFHMFMEKTFMSIQHIDNLSICCMDRNCMSIQHTDFLYICCMKKKTARTTYGQVFHMLNGK